MDIGNFLLYLLLPLILPILRFLCSRCWPCTKFIIPKTLSIIPVKGKNKFIPTKKNAYPHEGLEEFSLQICFELYTKIDLIIRNIKLRFDAKVLLKQKEIIINNSGNNHSNSLKEDLDGYFIMKNPQTISARHQANILVKEWFTCDYAEGDKMEYGIVTVEIDITHPLWHKGFITLIFQGKLEVGGELSSLKNDQKIKDNRKIIEISF